MKTDIIHLEPHDDLVSACDRMNWARSGRILLVWPERVPLLNRRLDLTLLKRHSQQLGAHLALVSTDRQVRYFAPRLGIPVYKTLRQAQNSTWRLPRRFRHLADRPALPAPPPKPPPTPAAEGEIPPDPLVAPPAARMWPWNEASQPIRLGFFALGVLAMLAIAATLLPSARITLVPRTEVQELVLDVRASPASAGIELTGWVPARPITVTVEGRKDAPVSGELVLPDQPASGIAVFTNLTDQAVDIPAGTVVRGRNSSPALAEPVLVRFATSRAGQAPAGSGQTVSLPVQALTPGASGNLPATSLEAIEGSLGVQLTVQNPSAMRHGSDRREPVPTAEDRRKLADDLRLELQKTALSELRNQLAPGDVLLEPSLKLARVKSEQVQPAEATPADRLDLAQQLEFQALAVSGADLRSMVVAILDANLTSGVTSRPESLAVENLSEPEVLSGLEEPTYRWSIHASRQIWSRLSEARAIQAVLGLAPAAAAQSLQARLPLEEPPQIQLFPAVWPRLPILPFRIEITITPP